MQKLAAVTGLVLGLVMIPAAAGAAPIGTNGCAVGATGYECDIFVDDVTGQSTLDLSSLDPTWLVGYSFLLNVGADLSDGIQDTDVAHALVIHSSYISLFTPIVGSSLFSMRRRTQGPSTVPGDTQFTRMPCSASSEAIARVNPNTAPFDAE